LKDLRARLGLDKRAGVRALYRGLVSVPFFARGYDFATQLAPSHTPVPARRPQAASDLEAYFEAHLSGPGIFKWRHYFDIYDRHLSRFRRGDVHVVEIGVAGGGSMGMWREYLGPDAQICGIDIDPDCTRFAGEGVEIVIGDQGDPGFWRSFLATHERIDVVIDDGGHEAEQQIATLESLLPHIRPSGVYICEDIHGVFHPFNAYLDGLTRPLNAVGEPGTSNPRSALQRQVASVHRYPILTVIEKAEWADAEFVASAHGTEWPRGWEATLDAAHARPAPAIAD
jgi:hypothetical protein